MWLCITCTDKERIDLIPFYDVFFNLIFSGCDPPVHGVITLTSLYLAYSHVDLLHAQCFCMRGKGNRSVFLSPGGHLAAHKDHLRGSAALGHSPATPELQSRAWCQWFRALRSYWGTSGQARLRPQGPENARSHLMCSTPALSKGPVLPSVPRGQLFPAYLWMVVKPLDPAHMT